MKYLNLSFLAFIASSKPIFLFEVITQGSTKDSLLTRLGERESFATGAELRQRYVPELLPEEFDPTQQYVVAGTNDAAYQSGIAHMMGWYPPGTGYNNLTQAQQQNAVPPIMMNETIKNGIQTQLKSDALFGGYVPVPVHSQRGKPFNMFLGGWSPDICPVMKSVQEAYIQSDLFDQERQEFEQKLFPRLGKLFGIKSVGWDEAREIVNKILADWHENRYTPYHVDTNLLKLCRSFQNADTYTTRFSLPTPTKVATTQVLTQLITLLNSTIDVKLYTIVNTPEYMAALVQVFEPPSDLRHAPPPASVLLVELNEFENKTQAVRVFYNDHLLTPCVHQYCLLSEFIEYLGQRLYTEQSLEDYCFSHDLDMVAAPQTEEEVHVAWWKIAIVTLPFVLLTLMIGLMINACLKKRKQSQRKALRQVQRGTSIQDESGRI